MYRVDEYKNMIHARKEANRWRRGESRRELGAVYRAEWVSVSVVEYRGFVCVPETRQITLMMLLGRLRGAASSREQRAEKTEAVLGIGGDVSQLPPSKVQGTLLP